MMSDLLSDEPMHILFVDDDTLLLRTLRRGFGLATFQAHFAESADEALRLCERQPIDVLVTDQRMPHMTGVELLAQVRERWPQVVRVMLTGNTDQTTAVKAVNDGKIFAFVNKPWEAEELRAAIDAALAEALRVRRQAAEQRAALTGRSSVRLSKTEP